MARSGLASISVALLAILVSAAAASAQQVPIDMGQLDQLTPEQRAQALQLLGESPEEAQQPSTGSVREAVPKGVLLAPVPGSTGCPPGGKDTTCIRSRRGASLYESSEGSRPLKPFGYDLFEAAPSTFAPATDIPVPVDYVLGPSDSLRIQLYGSINANYTLTVSRDGTVNFPKLGPINVAGLRFDDARTMLQNRIAKEMIGTQASVTIGELRSIQVYLLGDVNQPGSYTVSSLSTMTNALLAGGGVSLVGSLRNIQLKRDGKTVRSLDLYDLLLHGDSSHDSRLSPGDVIFVPPVGPRVSIDGEIKRPAVYELKGEATLVDVLALAGGTMASTSTTAIEVTRYDRNRKSVILQIDAADPSELAMRMQDGDYARVRKLAGPVDNRIRILGNVRYPGNYQWTSRYDLHHLLSDAQVLPSELGNETYLMLGAIQRTNPNSGVRSWIDFNVHDALEGNNVAPLQPDDVIAVFSLSDINYLQSKAVREVARGNFTIISTCPGLRSLAEIINSERAIGFVNVLNAQIGRSEFNQGEQVLQSQQMHVGQVKEGTPPSALHQQTTPEVLASAEDLACPGVFRDAPTALPFLLEQSAAIYGEVNRPGLYPITRHTPLAALIGAAAGRTGASDPDNIEYVSYQRALAQGQSEYQRLDLTAKQQESIEPGDIVNFRPLYIGQEIGSVKVAGEFRFPATYGILRGERLSELMGRAGGLTDNAYPYGAVFTREAARISERDSYQRAAKDLQSAMVTAASSGVFGSNSALSTQFISSVVEQLKSAPTIGRVVIEANPAVLQKHPDIDPVLEPGDALFIPSRPISVSIIGEVLNSGTVQYRPGRTYRQYIDEAGGFTQGADRGRTFLILPNGSTRPLRHSFWYPSDNGIPAGSVIVVPRDATPFNLLGWSDRIFSVVSQMAVTAAALNTITK